MQRWELHAEKYSENLVVNSAFTCTIKIVRKYDGFAYHYLEIYIKLDSTEENWQFRTDTEYHVLSSKNGVSSAIRYDYDDNLTPSSGYRGYSKFMSWDSLTDKSNGFITDQDEITVEILLYPHSISSPG